MQNSRHEKHSDVAKRAPSTTSDSAANKPAPKRTRAPKPAAQRVPTTAEILAEIFDDVLADYAIGIGLVTSIETRAPHLNVHAARTAIYENSAMLSSLLAVREHRAHFFFEAAGDQANRLAAAGFPKEAADLYLKLAAKTLPSEYGDKATIALTGRDGGPMKSEVSMTPSEAYRAMLGRQ